MSTESVIPVNTRFNPKEPSVMGDLVALTNYLDHHDADIPLTLQFHGGRYKPTHLSGLLAYMDTLALQRSLHGQSELPGIYLDLTDKRRIGSPGGSSKIPPQINSETGDKYVLVRPSENVHIGTSNGSIYDHHWKGSFQGNLGIQPGEEVVIDDGVHVQVSAANESGITGKITQVDRKDGQWFADNGFSSPARVNERQPGEKQLDTHDFALLDAIQPTQRKYIKGFDISFAGEVEKISEARKILNERGFEQAKMRLKIETAKGIKNLEGLATIGGVEIVFACGDLAPAMAEQGKNIEDSVREGLQRLSTVYGEQKKTVYIAYDFGDWKNGHPEIAVRTAKANARHAWFAQLQKDFPNIQLGIWHTKIAIQQKNGVAIYQNVIAPAQAAIKEHHTQR